MIMQYFLFVNGLKAGTYDLEGDARFAFLEACFVCNFKEDVIVLIDSEGNDLAKF